VSAHNVFGWGKVNFTLIDTHNATVRAIDDAAKQ
jgi:hypothetical protein